MKTITFQKQVGSGKSATLHIQMLLNVENCIVLASELCCQAFEIPALDVLKMAFSIECSIFQDVVIISYQYLLQMMLLLPSFFIGTH